MSVGALPSNVILGSLPVGERVGIAFSGGLDTCCAVAWMLSMLAINSQWRWKSFPRFTVKRPQPPPKRQQYGCGPVGPRKPLKSLRDRLRAIRCVIAEGGVAHSPPDSHL